MEKKPIANIFQLPCGTFTARRKKRAKHRATNPRKFDRKPAPANRN